MKSVRLTAAEAIVRYLIAQRTVIDGVEVPLVPGVFAIFGHGNVTCLGPALHAAGDELPTWRGQNEQGMALAAVAYAKAMRRRQFMVATSSIGPGALNMVTAAGVAMVNRLPVLLLSGDTFQSRLPDPVLQQVERFGDPSTTANDAFRPVVRYWDRISRPEQVVQSLPQAIADTAGSGGLRAGLPRVCPRTCRREAYDFPARLFEPVVHELRRPRPDRAELDAAAAAIRQANSPLLVAGGGVHYSFAEAELAAFAERHGIPVVETVAGKSCVTWDHPMFAGPIGVIGCESANRLAAEADVVVAVGTRLQDFTTGSWTVFGHPELRIVNINTARFDAGKHLSTPVVGDALRVVDRARHVAGGLEGTDGLDGAGRRRGGRLLDVRRRLGSRDGSAPDVRPGGRRCVRSSARRRLRRSPPSGGFPGELNNGWRSKGIATFDCEYGFSCMGYEISGGWGAAMARARLAPDGRVIVFVGDGSYLMMNSDLYSSVLAGPPMIVDRLRQRRVRRDRPAAGQPGWRVVQQPARRLAHRRRRGSRRLRRARRVDGLYGTAGRARSPS